LEGLTRQAKQAHSGLEEVQRLGTGEQP
jgi:hypothetical protein